MNDLILLITYKLYIDYKKVLKIMKILRTVEYRDYIISVYRIENQTESITDRRVLEDDETILNGSLVKKTFNPGQKQPIKKNIDDVIEQLQRINPQILREQKNKDLYGNIDQNNGSDYQTSHNINGFNIGISVKRS